MKPNIFNVATKELSQDAFFTWLLQWADGSNKSHNKELFLAAQDFIKLLISKQLGYDKQIVKVKAGRQRENIDIWAEVNDEVFIIIEDKTFTGAHSNQLETYKKVASDWCKNKNHELVCIYLKTGSEANASLDTIENKGYAVVNRPELLNYFSKHSSVDSDIFNDFVERIGLLEKQNNSFETLPIKNWNRNSWEGFYQFLQTQIKVNGWRYVANPAGGFLGLWWHSDEWKDYNVYLQIEEGNLCFKIGEVYNNHSHVRNEWYSNLMAHAKKLGRKEIIKPRRFGSGTYMTVAIVERKHWLGPDDSIVILPEVVQRLKEYEQFIDTLLEQFESAEAV
ncbi:PD-(D/E)XK nuclease family protein [Pontibacter ramchanderi]|uniref:PD-(D/E)XK nuclease superfamily protein n=1 Tax=Pontibacter ramchanderi TaxID=1179743 RepID=A0A2N3V0Z3_9BACT|nr:PD-(D/E)XK nuclease family protein [Pontibacter ramchanderi]PKV75298.1 PD-(D/E)XK nuclease superfamily protein [Pontibacter ramchanderi]